MVTTLASAPGGARTEKVGLPFDPDLFDHMVEHGVVVEVMLPLSLFFAASSICTSLILAADDLHGFTNMELVICCM